MPVSRRRLAAFSILAAVVTSCGSAAKPAAQPTTTAPASTTSTTGATTASTATPATQTPVTHTPTTQPQSTESGATGATPPTEPAGTAPGTTAASPTSPFAVQLTMETFVDTSRPTAATPTSPLLPARTIVTTIWSPQAPGPFALIVLNHGFGGTPAKFSRLATAWATAGYVVAAPAFPLTNQDSPSRAGNLGDVVNQPADDSFVIDSVLKLNADDSSPLFGRVDADRIGVSGHSLGAATTYGVSLNSCCVDRRIKAVIIMAGFVGIDEAGNDYTRALPVLILHGDADPTLNIAIDRGVYDRLAGPKHFITLLGGLHSTGFENGDSPYNDVVDASTTDFWNAYLAGDPLGVAALVADAAVDGVSTFQSGQ